MGCNIFINVTTKSKNLSCIYCFKRNRKKKQKPSEFVTGEYARQYFVIRLDTYEYGR